MMSLSDWKFVAPILIGQTLHLRLGVLAKEAGTSRRVGRINRSLQLLDQTGAVIQDGKSDVAVLKRDA